MKKVLVLILIIVSTNTFAKSVNLDNYLKNYYDSGNFQKCYELTKIINKGYYSDYYFKPFGIKYNDKVDYISSKTKYYEFHSLQHIDINSFNYHYMIQNDEVLKYFTKDELYPQFLKWVDSLYHIPNINEFGILLNNNLSAKPKNCDVIKEIKDDVRLTFKLSEIYKFLSKTDTIARNNIFRIDNSDLINFMSVYKNVDLLSLYTPDFDYLNCWVHLSGRKTDIQKNASDFFKEVCKKNRFINEEQISNYLYNNNLTQKQKMFVTFYFFSNLLEYSKKTNTNFTEYSDIEKIILYKATVCNGYSNILQHFLTKINVECYKIRFKTNSAEHACNIMVIDNKAYYVDLTWGLYFKEINLLKNTTIITPGFDARDIKYDKIKSLDFVLEFYNNEYKSTKEHLINIIKKGSL